MNRTLAFLRFVWGLLCGMLAAGTVSPIALPSAEWIWAAGEPRPAAAQFTRNFAAKSGVQSAVMLGACEGRMTIRLNGERVGEVRGRERGSSFEVTRHVRAGQNAITIEATGGANAAIAVILELVFDTGKHEWIVTDGSWSDSSAATAGAKPVARLGRVDSRADQNPFESNRAVDAYNSWTLARGANRATDPADIHVPPGFTVELLRSAQPGEDSWVSMAFDPRGRITVAKERQPGLLRLTLGATAVEKVEVINTTLLECRGLLYAFGALYAHANNSKALFRLRDIRGDDRFDEVKELMRTEGGSGHGRNHVRLGPDGMLYVIVGDDIAMPPAPAANSPFKRFSDLPWLPGPRDSQIFSGDRVLSGYLARTNAEGTRWEIIAGGLRNALDIAFNPDGEMFTYEADNERDIGNPWYKPTRVHHLVSGGDYAWRRGVGVLPSHCPDVLPTMHEVGLGSPTGIEFGTRSHFPEKYRRALFIADWAYGRILAMHLEARGASYTATRKEFITGRPLNVTDLAFGPDGAMYFITGGRATQSGLYRVHYAQGAAGGEKAVPANDAFKPDRELRHQLEAFHGHDNSANGRTILASVWPQLGHNDRWIRHAARIALETVEPSQWREQALNEAEPLRAFTSLLALARIGDDSAPPAIVGRLNSFPFAGLNEDRQLDALRIYELALPRLGDSHAALVDAAVTKLSGMYPSPSRWVNRELCKLLVNLRAPEVIAKTAPLLAQADNQEDVVHFLFFLRHAPGPWTLDQRRAFFTALSKVGQAQGAQNFQRVVREIKTAAAASLTAAERKALAPLLEDKSVVLSAVARNAPPPQFVRDWPPEELDAMIDGVARRRSFAGGRAAFATAQCIYCHRVGTAPGDGGTIGPDLTAIASRFGRHDILEAIVNPSKAMDDKYRSTVFHLKDGGSVSGSIESEDSVRVLLRPNPLGDETMELRTGDISSRTLSEISPMPTGLLNFLERDQILDLMAFLESGGNPAHSAFKIEDAAERKR